MNQTQKRIPFLVKGILIRPSKLIRLPKQRLYEQTRSGSVEFENKKLAKIRETSELERFQRNIRILQKETKWSWESFKTTFLHHFRADDRLYNFHDQELVKFWDFNQTNNSQISSFPLDYKKDKYNDLHNWFVTCDADFDIGYSSCSWSPSLSEYGLFSGFLDNTLPRDGKVSRTGYAYLGSFESRLPFFRRRTHEEFSQFTHVVLRVRGDGRRYNIIFDVSEELDITWFHRFQYPFYTHGGPYWQYIKIPLTRFFFQYQGYLQDSQFTLKPEKIRSMGILVYDSFSGPFRLEIDYIGFLYDSQHKDKIEYEGYFIESHQIKSLGSI